MVTVDGSRLLGEERAKVSKYASEAIWRKSLLMQQSYLRRLDQPEYAHLPPKERVKMQHRIDRIWAAGDPDWQQRAGPNAHLP